MNLQISPSKSLSGAVQLPGDKSISHRAALLASIAAGESTLENFLNAGVTRVMLSALATLGVATRYERTTLQVISPGWRQLVAPTSALDCGNSATTMRLLAGFLAGAGLPATLDGSPGLRRRPMRRLAHPLTQMGILISTSPDGTAPLVLARRTTPIRGQEVHLDIPSAQVKTALLLAALAANSPTTIHEPGPSRNHTENLFAHLGLAVTTSTDSHSVTLNPLAGKVINPFSLLIPGDFSSAAFLLVAALVTPGSTITLEQVGLNPTRTGLLDVLLAMGARIETTLIGHSMGEPYGTLRAEYAPLSGVAVSGPTVVRMIDEFPAFAIAAACASGRTVVSGAQELRHKESDRIASLCAGLSALGVPIQEHPDGFTIQGSANFPGGKTACFGDHRLAMAFALLGLVSDRAVIVENADIVAESYPSFTTQLAQLGAAAQWHD